MSNNTTEQELKRICDMSDDEIEDEADDLGVNHVTLKEACQKHQEKKESKTDHTESKKVLGDSVYPHDIFGSDPKIVLVIGKPKKGKSHFIKYLLYSHFFSGPEELRYKFGIVFTGSKFNSEFPMLPEKSIHDFSMNKLSRYINKLRAEVEQGHKVARNFVILDDVVGSIKSSYDSKFKNIITCFRKTNTDFYIATQYVNDASTGTVLRACVTHAVMFKTMDNPSIKSLYKAFGGLFRSERDFQNHLLHRTRQKYTAMIYFRDNDEEDDVNFLKNNYLGIRAPEESYDDYPIEYQFN